MKKFLSILLSAAMLTASVPVAGVHVSAAEPANPVKIVGMQTDHMTDPIGIDSQPPVFYWKRLKRAVRNRLLTAFRLPIPKKI